MGKISIRQRVDAYIEQFEGVMAESVKRSAWIFKDICTDGGSGKASYLRFKKE